MRNTVALLSPGLEKSITFEKNDTEGDKLQQKAQTSPGGDTGMELSKDKEETKNNLAAEEPFAEYAKPNREEPADESATQPAREADVEKEDVTKLKKNIVELKTSLKTLEDQCSDHRKKHDEDSQVMDSLKLEKDQHLKEKESAANEVTKISKDLETLKKLEEGKIKEIDDLKEEISAKEDLISKQEISGKQLKSDLQLKEKELIDLHAQLSKAQKETATKISQLTKDNEELQTKLKTVYKQYILPEY